MQIVDNNKSLNKLIKHIKFYLNKIPKDNMINNVAIHQNHQNIQDQIIMNKKIKIDIEVIRDKKDGEMKSLGNKLCNKYLDNNKEIDININIREDMNMKEIEDKNLINKPKILENIIPK